MPVMKHMLKLKHVPRHVPVMSVLKHVPKHVTKLVTKQMAKHVPGRHNLSRYMPLPGFYRHVLRHLGLDWFQIEVIDGESVYVCNLCNEGFDGIDSMKKHLSIVHKEEIESFCNTPKENLQTLDEILENT